MRAAAATAWLVCLGALPAHAEPLAGEVHVRGSLSPVPDAEIEARAGELVLRTHSDARGRFTLALPAGAAVELRLAAAGFEPASLSVAAGARKRLRVALKRRLGRYESVIRGATPHAAERHAFSDEEMHQAPGAAGEPARVVSFLPGVGTPLPLLPVFVVRGASPGMNGFFLDGMRVPQLFHLLVGTGVVHPRLLDRLEFLPGGYDASYGRYAGGIIEAETRPARDDAVHGEFELRLYDVSGLVEAPLGRGVRVAVGVRYGYPGLILHAIDNRLSTDYVDYIARLDWRGLTIEALGSYDRLQLLGFGDLPQLGNELRQTFHRLQVRYRARFTRVDVETALVGGIDEASGIAATGVRKLSLAARALVRARWRYVRLGAGAELELSRFRGENFGAGMQGVPDEYGDLVGDRDGVVAGAWAQLTLVGWRGRLVANLGVRADVYHAGEVTLLGVDPRLSVDFTPVRWLALRVAGGLYQQPPSFPIALPGIDTFALQLGLQRAWQGSVGVEARLPSDVTFSLTGYYQRFANIVDPITDLSSTTVCRGAPPGQLPGLPADLLRIHDGAAWGMELLVRRHRGRWTGWISYTLARSERTNECGTFAADFDQTHILNVVLQIRLPRQIMLGLRWYFASGRPYTLVAPTAVEETPRNNARLPGFVEVDVRLDREWLFRRWALSLFVELLNLTYSEATYGVTYPDNNIGNPQLYRFRWILPSLGLRARF